MKNEPSKKFFMTNFGKKERERFVVESEIRGLELSIIES